MPPSLFYSPADVAQALDISKSSVRRWGDALAGAGLLSEYATPSPPPRQYTEEDVRLIAWAVLQGGLGLMRGEVVELAKEGINEEDLPSLGVMQVLTTKAETQRELSELASETLVLSKAASAMERIAEAVESKETLSELSRRLEGVEARLDAIERRLDALPGWLKRRWKP